MTPREPDRYTNAEWQRAARILDACLNGSHEHDEGGLVLAAESWRPIAAALRAAEASALERAARIARRYSHHAEREIRALIPPAAANAAETCPLYCGAMPAAPGSHHMNDCGLYAYPAAETAEALLRECDDVLARVQGHGCPPSDESIAALRAKLRARAAPPEGEGTT